MNYQIITDNEALRGFISWLPTLQPQETFYVCLFARSKYCKDIAHISSDKAQLKRFTSNKSMLYNKIWQLECPIGAYTAKEVGTGREIPVPQEALALYITINPRSLTSCTKPAIVKLLDLATQPFNGYNPHQEVMSEIQKAKSRSAFVSFDFDVSKESWPYVMKLILQRVNRDALSIVETRGGYHVIVEPDRVTPEFKGMWYMQLANVLSIYSSDTDNKGDIMLPVPGTSQGGFTPRFIA